MQRPQRLLPQLWVAGGRIEGHLFLLYAYMRKKNLPRIYLFNFIDFLFSLGSKKPQGPWTFCTADLGNSSSCRGEGAAVALVVIAIAATAVLIFRALGSYRHLGRPPSGSPFAHLPWGLRPATATASASTAAKGAHCVGRFLMFFCLLDDHQRLLGSLLAVAIFRPSYKP